MVTLKHETVEQYLARGGVIKVVPDNERFYDYGSCAQWKSQDPKNTINGGATGVERYKRSKMLYSYFSSYEMKVDL